MCPSFTWGTASIHYLLGLPLAYALRSATPNGLMLLVKLTYSPVLLRPIESPCLWSPMCFFLLALTTHCPALPSVFWVPCCRQYHTHYPHGAPYGWH